MKDAVLYRGAQRYVKVPVTVEGEAPEVDVTVEMAIVAEGTEPEDSDLVVASWGDTFMKRNKTWRYAQLLTAGSVDAATGAQDVTLSPGGWDIFVKITEFPEVPMMQTRNRLAVT